MAPNLSRGAERARRCGRRARLSKATLGALVVGIGLAPVVVAVRSCSAARAGLGRGRDEERAVILGPRLADPASRQTFGVGKGEVWARLTLRAVGEGWGDEAVEEGEGERSCVV